MAPIKEAPRTCFIVKEHDHYLCAQGKVIPFKKIFLDSRTKTKKKSYRASSKICKGCPLRETCLGKVNEKQFSVTYYRDEYERNIARVQSPQGRYMKGKRQSTVEPVFGTLTQFMGLRKINTIGIKQANKVMHLSAIAYNLKKYLKFEQKRSNSEAGQFAFKFLVKSVVQGAFSVLLKHPKLTLQY
ncbi:Transposase DDE domain-containing protein [Maribacter arcticus]|uniref:Transposase DDE domain-containing protein n=2 Tax=Maribacter arcticus TaxID=561365 RepID=A0A1T5B5P8_9FLAO|nr:Transposase DDE domain-containing protein [Maribacter arcticus]